MLAAVRLHLLQQQFPRVKTVAYHVHIKALDVYDTQSLPHRDCITCTLTMQYLPNFAQTVKFALRECRTRRCTVSP